MTETREIALGLIFPPENLQRTDMSEDAMVELCESIDRLGLLQPVGVTPLEDGYFRLVWGTRRFLAHRRMKRETIRANIVAADEREQQDMILHENLHREEVNPLDEANWLARYMAQFDINQEEMARRAKCSPARVGQLLSLLRGDPKVAEALKNGRISKAQALAINRVRDESGRVHALHWCTTQGMSAEVIVRWQKEREEKGIEQAVESINWGNVDQVIQEVRNQSNCVLHNGWVDYSDTQFLAMCKECWKWCQWARKTALEVEARETEGA